MKISMAENFSAAIIAVAVLMAGLSFLLPNFLGQPAAVLSIKSNVSASQINLPPAPPPPPQKLTNPPAIIKSVYVTGYSAGSKAYLNYLKSLFISTEINAAVIDIKGSDGYVTYASQAPNVKKYNLSNNAISDIDGLVRFLHNQNIYVIGRIAVFEDPVFSKVRPEFAIYDKTKKILWQDNHGLGWLDPASKDVWDYEVSLAKDAFYNGFDEVNFDYVRFPSDGKTEEMGFPFWDQNSPAGESKADTIKNFFQYLRQNLAGEKLSVDLFGLTTVNTDDMGIGQIIENAFANFDYVCPMVYPSHYADGFIGFQNPADHPYEVIKYSLDSAVVKAKPYFNVKLRPWLQDFNMGADYTADMVGQEIKATQDSLGNNFSGFMLWNPSNIYTQSALLRPN